MPDKQVYSIYQDIQKRNKKKEEAEKQDILHHQYTLDEWITAFKKGANNEENNT